MFTIRSKNVSSNDEKIYWLKKKLDLHVTDTLIDIRKKYLNCIKKHAPNGKEPNADTLQKIIEYHKIFKDYLASQNKTAETKFPSKPTEIKEEKFSKSSEHASLFKNGRFLGHFFDDVTTNQQKYIGDLIELNKKSSNKLISAILNNESLKEINNIMEQDKQQNNTYRLTNFKDIHGNSILHIAGIAGRSDVLELLASKKDLNLDANLRNKYNFTPLQITIMANRNADDCIKPMIELGGDLHQTTDFTTPFLR